MAIGGRAFVEAFAARTVIGGSVGTRRCTFMGAGVVEDAASLLPGRTCVTADTGAAATGNWGLAFPGIGGGGRG